VFGGAHEALFPAAVLAWCLLLRVAVAQVGWWGRVRRAAAAGRTIAVRTMRQNLDAQEQTHGELTARRYTTPPAPLPQTQTQPSFGVRIALAAGTVSGLGRERCGTPIGVTLR
jgi:hypothetical protein